MLTPTKIDSIRIRIAEIFDLYSSSCVSVADVGCHLEIYIDNDQVDVSFANLKQVSEMFTTDKIDVNTEMEQRGYCETCSYETQTTTIFVKDWKYE